MMNEVRCEHCNKLLAKTTGEAVKNSESVMISTFKIMTFQIKCNRCGLVNNVDITDIQED